MTQARITATFVAVTCLAMLCGRRASAQESGAASSNGGCRVQVTGAVTTGWKVDWQPGDDEQSGNVGAVSDYWLSDDEIAELLEDLAGPGEDKAKKVLQGMRHNPRFSVLLLNCVGGAEGHLFIRPSAKSIYQDIPRKAQSYKIAAERTAAAGQFVVSSLKLGKNRYRVTDGRFDLKKFNFERVVARFVFKATPVAAEDKGQEVTVEGSFNVPCTGSGSRCRSR
jgi:hypothetical protein